MFTKVFNKYKFKPTARADLWKIAEKRIMARLTHVGKLLYIRKPTNNMLIDEMQISAQQKPINVNNGIINTVIYEVEQ